MTITTKRPLLCRIGIHRFGPKEQWPELKARLFDNAPAVLYAITRDCQDCDRRRLISARIESQTETATGRESATNYEDMPSGTESLDIAHDVTIGDLSEVEQALDEPR